MDALTKLKAEHKILEERTKNWRSKEMPAYRREVERKVQLEAEIERLSAPLQRDNVKGGVSQHRTETGSRWYESTLEVLRRRQIVLRNPEMADKSLCKVFDTLLDPPPIPLPERWEKDYSVTTWVQAYSVPKLRQRIHKIISTDRSVSRH